MIAKRLCNMLMLLCAATMLVFVPASAQAAKPIVWKAASIYAPPMNQTTNSKGIALQKFAQMVEERSGGRMKIELFWNAVLGGSMEIFDQMRMGEIEIFYGQPMATSDKRFGVWNVPYLFASAEEVIKIACDPNGKMFKLADKWMQEKDAKLLAVGLAGMRGFVNSKKPIKLPSDLRDMKCRIYQDPIVDLFWKGLCNATPLPLSELYTSLQTGTVDGTEFQATAVLTNKLFEVTKYYSDIDWQWVSNANMVASKPHWDKLPADLQKIVSESAIEAMKLQGEMEQEFLKTAYTDLRAKGIEVYTLTPEEKAEWVKYARSLDAKMRAAIGPETYDAIMAAIQESKAAK